MISDWDDAYANGAYISGGAEFPDRWAARAAAYRASAVSEERARLDISYGVIERERLDLFLPRDTPRGSAIFVHGGYWRAFDKSVWSHLAQGAVALGYAFAIPSYSLCPTIGISGITAQIARAVSQVAGMVAGPVHLAGHSAGGHLVSRMACASGPLGQGTAARLAHVLSISGVHDLRPLIRTEMNRDLRLDLQEATAESPALHMPRDGTRLTAWVGADERPEFVRQSRLIANIWTGCGAGTTLEIEPGKHHFDVIDALADPDSAMMRHWLSSQSTSG